MAIKRHISVKRLFFKFNTEFHVTAVLKQIIYKHFSVQSVIKLLIFLFKPETINNIKQIYGCLWTLFSFSLSCMLLVTIEDLLQWFMFSCWDRFEIFPQSFCYSIFQALNSIWWKFFSRSTSRPPVNDPFCKT